MTNETNRPVEIGQGDREAAVKWLKGRGEVLKGYTGFDEMLRGEYDHHSLVQLLARHAASAREEERAITVAWLQSLKDAPGLPAFGFKPHDLQGIYANGFADAIERGDHLKALSIVGEGG